MNFPLNLNKVLISVGMAHYFASTVTLSYGSNSVLNKVLKISRLSIKHYGHKLWFSTFQVAFIMSSNSEFARQMAIITHSVVEW
jgi:hypothetical protein